MLLLLSLMLLVLVLRVDVVVDVFNVVVDVVVFRWVREGRSGSDESRDQEEAESHHPFSMIEKNQHSKMGFMAWHSKAWHSMAWHSMAWSGVLRDMA